jgi:hypothetical protein
MGSLRSFGGAVAASSLLILAAASGARAQDWMQTTSPAALVLSMQPRATTQVAQSETPETGPEQPESPLLQSGAGAMPRPMSPLLRLPGPREATGESVEDDLADEVQYVDPERGETVRSRKRPELEPLGVRVGSFLLFPSITAEEEFNSNIFATSTDEESDLISHVKPGLIVDSDWNRHRVTFRADADLGFYTDNDSEDFQDYRAGAAGRLDISEGAYLTASADYMHLHEDRGSPDDVRGEEPTEFDDIAVRGAYYQEFGRFRARVLGSFDDLDFSDVPSAGGDINNDDRDRYEGEGVVRIGFEVVPMTEVYVQGSYNVRDYQASVDDAGFDRDSHGFAGDIGAEVDFGGIVFGDFFVGYREQDYEDPAFDTISGVDAGATITWNVTPLTTVVGTVRRTVEETITAGSSGFFGTEFTVSVDHELLRNLILTGEAGYINRDYDGISREDDVLQASLAATYMMNRNIYLKGRYKFTDRTSTDDTVEYDQHVGLVSLTLQY